MTESVLEITGLSKTFPGQKALIDVDFEVRAGEVHALVGQNGSGKSTLIKCLAGYHEPDLGATASVWQGGPTGRTETSFRLGDGRAAEAAGVRFVHQDLALVETLDAVENLALGEGYPTKARTIDWRQARRQARRELSELGYDFDVTTPIAELTAAERTGVAIARAMHNWENDVELVVLDEPTASMPGPDVERLFDVIRTVRDRGLAVVYVSHHLDEIFHIADRVTVLRDGRKVDTREMSSLEHDGLIELIVGRNLAEEFRTELASDQAVAGEPMLKIDGLVGDSVENLDLEVRPGEIVGVAGITGSGREAIAQLLFGGRRRDAGRVTVDGTDVPTQRPDKAIAAGLGLAPADRKAVGIVPEMTVRENITLPRLGEFFRGLLFRHRAERIDARGWLDELDVQPRQPEREVKNLSGGNQQKVVLAKWLRLKPKVLVLDEPTQGVDVGAKADIHRLIDAAAEEGMAVLVCSTDSEELVRLCSRVVVMQRGRRHAELHGGEITVETLEGLQLQVSQEVEA